MSTGPLPDSLALHYTYYLIDGKDYALYSQITPEANPAMVYTAENDYDGLVIHDYYRMVENIHSVMVGGVEMASNSLLQPVSGQSHKVMHVHTPTMQEVWRNGALEDATSFDLGAWGDKYVLIGWAPPWDQSLEMHLDDIFVRKYSYPEPIVSVGEETTPTSSQVGISLSASADVTLLNNQIRGSGDYACEVGIDIQGSVGWNLDGNTVEANIGLNITNSASALANPAHILSNIINAVEYGMILIDCENISIENNTVTGSGGSPTKGWDPNTGFVFEHVNGWNLGSTTISGWNLGVYANNS
ncbi:MAG: right-handed parallel beta-helix repeat-containing protein, partial [Thermoplasmata archaeon]|nr:right-handed parallel beta-helix repeat-containing protein [Thermoplasmata archaeon]